ncbi:antithrombin-III-like isoform X2 [Vespula squamosa]|uniref:Antithrombin-III-like isoform X2 n=1 Tax=Vespula squamosa TaxID=30214 RepID=A0ABD2BR37_VESSQ
MKLIEILGCILFLWSVLLVPTTKSAVMQRQQKDLNVTNPTMKTNVSTYDDDDEDFVPYQGERFNVFDWMLFKTIGKKYSGNILLSPISVKMALVLLYEGAQDQTAHELAGVMQLPASRSATRDKFSEILQSLRMICPQYELDIGTRLYVDTTVSTRQRYAAIVETFYGVNLINTNLSDTRLLTEEVNAWVKNVTHGNIGKLIEDENNLKDSVMLVVNALFFKGTWRRQYFLAKNTYMGKFYSGTNNSVDVPFMTTINRFYYSESPELDAKILRIPYDGHKFAMYLILPYTLNGVDHLLTKINPFILTRHVWLMQDIPVEVIIPKFKFDFTSHLEPSLRELGIRDIFDDTATLTGIAKTKRVSRHLIVSDVLQKTGIEVNENGTTAYAATGIQIGNKITYQTFHANHPFVFYIEDESTGTILYIGKITNPLQQEGSTGNAKMDFTSHFGQETRPSLPVTSDILLIPHGEERYNFFNIDLFQAVNKEIEGNVIMSPTSAKLALTTLAEGAKGQTRQEIQAALRMPEDLQEIRTIARRTFASLKTFKNGTEIDVATRLWTKNGLKIMNNYNTVLKHYYDGDIQSLNFTNGYTAEETINNWVRAVTRNNVKSILEPGSLNADTTLILTSALYFKGRWQKSFNKNAGFTDCFYVPKIGCQNTIFMATTAEYSYGHIASLNADAIKIPYTDGKTAMIVLLPNNHDLDPYLQILSKDLSYIPMSALLANLYISEVNLILPKFSIESKLDLRSALEHLGVHSIFEMTADLSGITEDGPLYVKSILQNAKIEVDEEGTVAAAVTGLSIVPLIGSSTENFRANRPFLFAIVDLQTNTTLFAGRYIRPNLSN